MKRILFVLAFAMFSFNSFAKETTLTFPEVTTQQSTSIKLYIDAKGKIYVDGKKTSMSNLKSILTQLKEKNGFVKIATALNSKSTIDKKKEVILLLREKKLTTQVFSDNTFSKRILL